MQKREIIKENMLLIFIYSAILFLCFLFSVMGLESYSRIGKNISLLDGMCVIESKGKFLVFPFLSCFLIYIFREDFRSGVILRYVSFKENVSHIIKKSVIVSAVVSVIQVIISLIVCFARIRVIFNWDSMDSFGFYMSGKLVENNHTFVKVIMMYSYCVFIQVMLIVTIICLTWWMFQTPIAGVILMIAWLTAEATAEVIIFFNIISMDVAQFINYGFDWTRVCAYPLVLLIILYIIMAQIIKHIDLLRFS